MSVNSFEPVRLAISVPRTVRVHHRLAVEVTVTADPGVLDIRTAALRVQIKLATECGGTYRHTNGTVLLDHRLKPQPRTGHPYRATVRGHAEPAAAGVKVVCAWLTEEGDERVFASDQSLTIEVKRR
jgi:hypothetical protein